MLSIGLECRIATVCTVMKPKRCRSRETRNGGGAKPHAEMVTRVTGILTGASFAGSSLSVDNYHVHQEEAYSPAAPRASQGMHFPPLLFSAHPPQILDALPAPLPPTLPPSPPASPPSFLGKRKQDPQDTDDRHKRPRNDHPLPPPPPPPSEPVEDGEVAEEPPLPPSLPPPSSLPLRRPKHGPYDVQYYDGLHNKYHQEGRELKFSGDARFWSTFPRTSKDYRPLQDPPPTDSLYHKNGIQIAKLELIDALVRFTFAIWNKDYSRSTCNFELWDSSDAYIEWCKNKWVCDDSTNEAEKAFRGLM